MDGKLFLLIFALMINYGDAAKALGSRRKPANRFCPIVDDFDSLELRKLKGTWFVVYSSIYNNTDKCNRFVISTTNSSSKISLFKKYVRKDGIEVKMMGTVVDTDPGSFAAEYPAYPGLTVIYDVLTTDYDNYAILYTCSNDYNVWILSRKMSIEKYHLSLACYELARQGLTNFYLYPLLQDCPMSNF